VNFFVNVFNFAKSSKFAKINTCKYIGHILLPDALLILLLKATFQEKSQNLQGLCLYSICELQFCLGQMFI